MRLTITLVLSIFFLYVKGQTTLTPTPNYFCDQDEDTVEFTLSPSYHSAWNSISNCALQECTVSSNNNDSCRSSTTPCFDYRTISNTRYCAPGILCSILEPCNTSTYTCVSNTSVCIVNSCCSTQPICLPLAWTDFCKAVSETTTTMASVSTSTSSTRTITSTASSSSPSLSTSSTSTSSTTSVSSTTSSTSKTTSTTSRTSTTTSVTSVSTTPITTAITTTYPCYASAPSSFAWIYQTTNTSWIQQTFNYVANKTALTLMFGVDASTVVYIALDDISIVDTANASVQLLTNPSFANSTSTPTGWTVRCSSTCNAGVGGSIITSNCRTNNCYKSQCGGGGLDYLVQTFSAIIGRTYTVSFWYQRVKYVTGSVGATLYYATSTTTTTTTTYNCGATFPTQLGSVSGTTNTTWTRYAFNYTATKTVPTLIFGFDESSAIYIAIDDISVVDATNSSFQLLDNPSFESSTTVPTEWTRWCSNTCSTGTAGAVITSNCYKGNCGGGDKGYIAQTFPATIGRIYTVSFWTQHVRMSSGGSTVTVSVGIV